MRAPFVLALFGAFASLGAGLAFAAPSISADATAVGAMTNVSGASPYMISGGMIVGGKNQFLSFGQFGLNTGESATFSGPAGIQNILARVTGGAASNIDGSISSSISGANLFLINPSGVMFGAHASVNVSGAFTVSTANYIQLMDNTKFYADTVNAAINDGGLSAASVASFGFLGTNTGAISALGTTLTVPGGMQVISGPGGVSLTNSKLSVTSGVLGVFSGTNNNPANDGIVPYLTAAGQSYNAANGLTNINAAGTTDSVTMVNSSLASGAGGNVVIRGGMLVSADSTSTVTATSGGASANGISVQGDMVNIQGQVGSVNSAATGGGDVTVTATTSTTIDGGSITTATSGTGTSGGVTISTPTLTLENGGMVGSSSTSTAASGGGAGDVGVTTTGATQIASGGQISSTTAGGGNTGAVSVQSGTLTIGGSGSGIFASQTSSTKSGSVGAVTVTSSGTLALTNAGQIYSSTSGAATAGALIVSAPSLTVQGASAIYTTTAGSQNAANLTINDPMGAPGSVSLSGGSLIDSASTGAASTGTLAINDTTLTIAGAGSAISSLSNSSATGTAGTLTINSSGNVNLNSGGQISSSSNGTQTGAVVTVNANAGGGNALSIDGTGTGIYSTAAGGATSVAGTVNVTSQGGVSLTNGGQIGSTTSSGAAGGVVKVSASTIRLLNTGSDIYTSTSGAGDGGDLDIDNSVIGLETVTLGTGTQIGTISSAAGNAGDVTVHDASLSITGAGVLSETSSTATGSVGTITVTSGGSIGIDSSGLIGSISGGTSTGVQQTVTVNASGVIDLLNGGQISAVTSGKQFGSNVVVNANATPGVSLIIDGMSGSAATTGIFTSTSSTGNAGDVTVNDTMATITGSGAPINPLGTITPEAGIYSQSTSAASGNAGAVSVTSASSLSITNGAQVASFTAGATQKSNAGEVTIAVNSGTLNIAGTGGTTSEPVIYSLAANPFQSDGTVTINAFGTNSNVTTVNVSNAASIETFTNDASVTATQTFSQPSLAPQNVIFEAGILNLSENSTIQSMVAPDVAVGLAKTVASTGKVVVEVENGLDIESGAQIDTIANSTTTGPGTGTAGKIVVAAGTLTESGTMVAASGGVYPSQTNIFASNPTSNGGASPTPIVVVFVPGSGGTISLGPLPNATDVVIDGSFGSVGSNYSVPYVANTDPTEPGYVFTVTATDGDTVGDNLFLSFSDFNLRNYNETVDFSLSPTSTIKNILVRVIDGPATINGQVEETLGATSTIASANLFFLDASGITFGSTGGISVSGAFTISTASYTEMNSGGIFDSAVNSNDNLIRAGNSTYLGTSVSAFGFTPAQGMQIGNIIFDQTQIEVGSGSQLQVIGGNITLEKGANFSAYQGPILMFSAGGSGGVLSFATGDSLDPLVSPTQPAGETQIATNLVDTSFAQLGTISLSDNSVVSILGGDSGLLGTVVMRGDTLRSDSSNIVDDSQASQASQQVGNLIIDMNSLIQVNSTLSPSTIQTSTTGNDQGATMELDANVIDVDGASSSIFSYAEPLDDYKGNANDLSSHPDGAAGNITLNVGQRLEVVNGGQISTDTFGAGQAGNVTVQPLNTASAPAITLENGGQITSDTIYLSNSTYSSTGNAGVITVAGGSLTIDTEGSTTFTGISTSAGQASSGQVDPTGSGGNITVMIAGNSAVPGATGNITIRNGGQIAAATYAAGSAGSVSVTAGSLAIDGDGLSEFTGITTNAGTPSDSPVEPIGNGGDITVAINGAYAVPGAGGGDITILNGGEIAASSYTSGSCGTITASQFNSLDGQGISINGALEQQATGILANCFGTGNGSINPTTMVTVSVTSNGAVALAAGGEISSGTFYTGNGGDLSLAIQPGGSLALDGTSNPAVYDRGDFLSTGVISSTYGSGKAGDLSVSVYGAVSIVKGAAISDGSFYGTGNGGNMTVAIDGSLAIDGTGTPLFDQNFDYIPTGIITSSFLSFAQTNTGNAGNITVNVAGPVSIAGGGQISSGSIGGGAGGILNVSIAGSLSIDGSTIPVDPIGIFIPTGILSSTIEGGNAGPETVEVTGPVSLAGGGQISSGTFGGGSGGSLNLTINSGSLSINGETVPLDGSGNAEFNTGVLSSTVFGGNAGDMTVTVNGPVSIIAGGQISSETNGGGSGGILDLTINSGTLGIDGRGAPSATVDQFFSTPIPLQTGILSASLGTSQAGNANVSVSGGTAIVAGGQISSGTVDVGNGSGNGGDLSFEGGALSIYGLSAPTGTTGIFSTTSLAAGATANPTEGNAGVVTLTVGGEVSLQTGGQVSSATTTTGTAGTVNLNAGQLDIQGISSAVLTSSSGPASATGSGGAINIAVRGAIGLSNGGQINATTSTGQTGGSINIGGISSDMQSLTSAGELILNGLGSAITAAASGAGDGGNISITTGGVLNEGNLATISCSSLESNAGNLTITANKLIMQGGASIDTTASAFAASALSPVGNGGNIVINAGELVYLLNSDILTKATNVGGNITIDPEFVVLDDSVISAAGKYGDGNILISATFVLSSNSNVVATGTVSIDSLPLNLAGSLIALPGQLTDDEKRLRESCAASINHEFSSLIVVGRGGTETGPQELRPDFGMTEDPDFGNDSAEQAADSVPARP